MRTYVLLLALVMACAPKSGKYEHLGPSDHLVMATLWFQQSAEMQHAYEQAYHYATMLMLAKLDTFRSGSPAVVLDIDETVLDNSPYEVYLIQNGLTYTEENWKQWTDRARAAALPGALAFTQKAAEKGVEVYYITNRLERELESTLRNLDSLKFPFADREHVLLKSNSSNKAERRELVKAKHIVLVYVGDQLTDYSESYAQRGDDLGKPHTANTKGELLNNFVLVPNPMYGEWEGAVYGNDWSKSATEQRKLRKEALKQ
jgi:5'-nucleotidase (lipoprotein e(P4) family)